MAETHKRCGATHPRLSDDNACLEPASHAGPHMTHDSMGRPEWTWEPGAEWVEVAAAVPDPQRETPEEMAARTGLPVELLNARVRWVPQDAPAVPDPRFRDQLVSTLVERNIWRRAAETYVDMLMPTIAAEVEARVQAAANQGAVEIVTRVKAIPTYTLTNDDKPLGTVVLADDVLAALASPAPAPRAEEADRG